MKVRQEEFYTCRFCGSLYEVDSLTTPWDCLGNLSCDSCYEKNMDAFEKYCDENKEPEEYKISTGALFRRTVTGEYSDGLLTFNSFSDLLDYDYTY